MVPHPIPIPGVSKSLLPRGLTNQKINYLLRNDVFSIENMKTESRARHGGADCAPMPGGPWPNILIDPHRACRHVKCVLGGARGSRALLFNCLPGVCFGDDVGCKREPWPGVSGGTPYLFRHSGPMGPSGRIAFWRLIFASFFVMFFLYSFFMYFDRCRPPLWHHVGVIFNVFLHYFFEHRF